MEGSVTCTACQVPIGTQEEYKMHYKSDFHTYNLKRKTVSLPPVALEVYLQKKQESESLTTTQGAGACQVCGTTYASESAYQHHLRSKKHRDATEAKATHVPKVAVSPSALDPLLTCLFCSLQSPSIDQSLTHMLTRHGFFLPDVAEILDLEGLLKYLFEKVQVGNMCLYCNNKGAHAFSTAAATQQHMVDKQHCFLNIDEDVEEFAPFYAFEGMEGSDSSGSEDGEEEKEDKGEPESASSSAPSSATIPRERKIPGEVTPTGELRLPSGKLIGHKEYTRYYKQKYHASYVHHQEVLALMSDAYQSQVQVMTSWKLPESMLAIRLHNQRKKEEALKTGVLGNSLQKHYRKSHP